MTTTAPTHRLATNGRYVTWLVSDTAKGVASGLFGFAVPLIALFITDDPALAGVLGAVGMAVRTVTTIYGGVLADRHQRISMMAIGSTIGILLAASFTVLALVDALTFTSLMVLQVLLAARAGLFDIAGESAIKEIVPDDAMGRAQAANQGRDAVLQLIGGPLGGALLAAGAWLIGAAMSVFHAVAAVTAWMLLRSGRREASRPSEADGVSRLGEDQSAAPLPIDGTTKPNALREVRAGFSWLFSRPDLRCVLFVATIINLGFNTALTCAIYALQQEGHPPITIGLFATGAGVAMLFGALLAPTIVARVRASVIIIAGLAVAALGVAGMIGTTEPLALTILLAFTVFLIPALNAALMGYFMVATPSALLGRANSASAVLGMGAMPLAPLIAGFGVSWCGRGLTLVTASALCTIAVLLAATNRALRALPAEARWAAHAAQFADD